MNAVLTVFKVMYGNTCFVFLMYILIAIYVLYTVYGAVNSRGMISSVSVLQQLDEPILICLVDLKVIIVLIL